ncbi:RusA family crossover junction endodeoxyribonuclease [Endozoicomonas sp. ONNA2]|uniref:RusA family crossover junction endodeoxyribonuclease n=1 Tax=Endozoicomonas sp. ONNA2 TaxID=2828741 RepID=UPI0035A1A5E0
MPKSKRRPRFTRRGKCYTPATTRRAEYEVQWAARQKKGKMLAGPVGGFGSGGLPDPCKQVKKENRTGAGRIGSSGGEAGL